MGTKLKMPLKPKKSSELKMLLKPKKKPSKLNQPPKVDRQSQLKKVVILQIVLPISMLVSDKSQEFRPGRARILAPPLQQREYNLHLYQYQMLEESADGNQKVIVNPGLPKNFAVVVVNDWAIYDGILPNGKLVARAQGIHVGCGKNDQNWLYSFNMVFVDYRFNGSVLKVEGVNGPNPGASGQWAIVGGTGEFAHAQGTITYTDNSVNGGVMKELRIRVVCPDFAKQIPVIPAIKVPTQVGGYGGEAVDIATKPQRLESVTIRAGDVIDSISFSYIDEAGEKQSSGLWGDEGGEPVTINFKPTETVKKIWGTTGDFGDHFVVTSLKFVTNLATHGPYGKEDGTPFVLPAKGNDTVVGFHGRPGLYLNAIGVYTIASAAEN